MSSKAPPVPKKTKDGNTKSWRSKCTYSLVLPFLSSTIYYFYMYKHHYPKPPVNLDEWWADYPIDMQPDNSTRPFVIEFPEVIVNDLKERLLHRRPFARPLHNVGFQYGFNSDFLTRVLDYWQNDYKFQERANLMNVYTHYVTKIQGLDIHYVHVRPEIKPGYEVIPLLIIHNWPTSFWEYSEVIPSLVTHKEGQNFVFEVIVPSLPGMGFSQAPSRPGMGPIAIAVVLRNLMERIGHNKYYVHGGDFGHAVGSSMATLFPENVLGLHSNMPTSIDHAATAQIVMGAIWPTMLVESELVDRLYPLSKHVSTLLEESGYFHIQATKPDTIGIALSESPAGLAAYILEKFSTWTNLEYRKASDGGLLKRYSLTHLLDNIMIYWVTNSITTSMRHFVQYYSDMNLIDQIPTPVPFWALKFKHEIRFTPETILASKFINYLQTVAVQDGGQFPAMEDPRILAKYIWEAVTEFRKFHGENPKAEVPDKKPEPKKTVYDYTVKDIKGEEVSLEKYRGKVLIIVNVASYCGYTDNHYTQLNELYEKYAEKGLRILAFPCNQFGDQEPGTFKEIFQFTQKRNVKFDIFEKIDVNGDDAHPLWQFLKESKRGTLGDFIKWNFSKFIVDRNGIPVERFGPNVSPLELVPYLEKYW